MRFAAPILSHTKFNFLSLINAAIIAGFSLAFSLGLNTGSALAEEPVNPSKVRTAYLYHFMRFIDWPTAARPQGSDAYNICIPAISSESGFLDLITKKTVNDQPISIKHVDTMASLTNCHILYLMDSNPHEFKQYIEQINGHPVLSIGNGNSFLNAGGIIAFNVRKGQVTFSVNLKAASQLNFKISANMLDVAEKVIK